MRRITPDLFRLGERGARAALEDLTGHLFRQAIDRAEAKISDVARELGMGRNRVYRYLDEAEHRLPIAWLPLLPKEVARHLVNQLLEPVGLTVVEVPDSREVTTHLELAGSWVKEHSEALQALLAALADGVITRREGTTLEREGMDLVQVVMAVVELGRLAQREGVVGIARRRAEA